MSWEGHVNNLMGQGLEKVAILGLDGSVWATTNDFKIAQDEFKAFFKGFENKDTVTGTGVRLNGTKFFFIDSDADQIQGKKGQGGCSIAKAKTCVLVGVYNSNLQPGEARNAVEKYRDYFKDQGY